MKTAERENPNRRPQCVANRADGAASQYRSCSIMWAAKQENFQPAEKCFFLTSPFIELTGHLNIDWEDSLVVAIQVTGWVRLVSWSVRVSNVSGGINGHFGSAKAGTSKVAATAKRDTGSHPCSERFASRSISRRVGQSQGSQS